MGIVTHINRQATTRRRKALRTGRLERLLDVAASIGRKSGVVQLIFGGFLLFTSCSRPVPRDALVIAQTPRLAVTNSACDALDVYYPPGSRVIIATAGSNARTIRVLSTGLLTAGEPVVSCDAQRIVFAGKSLPNGTWQIYESRRDGGSIRQLTFVPGGAMDPALLPDGSLMFVSPVPKLGSTRSQADLPALYVQSWAGKMNRLAYSTTPVRHPTVLSDGRILFVSSQPSSVGQEAQALYTINNDGTEISAFAGQHDVPCLIERPRELGDGRIVFVAIDSANPERVTAETVSSARPFCSRAGLFPSPTTRIRAVQPCGNGILLICAQPGEGAGNSLYAVYKLNYGGSALETPAFSDPDWNMAEAEEVSASRRPMGRLSNVDPSHDTGQILCLDVNDSTYTSRDDEKDPRATKVRVFTANAATGPHVLGEVAVQADGSFMAEVPADAPLGFEALDASGRVLRREPPMIWVRPGENRSCVGCHEPHNHSPRNFRPLAVRAPVPKLCGDNETPPKILSAK